MRSIFIDESKIVFNAEQISNASILRREAAASERYKQVIDDFSMSDVEILEDCFLIN